MTDPLGPVTAKPLQLVLHEVPAGQLNEPPTLWAFSWCKTPVDAKAGATEKIVRIARIGKSFLEAFLIEKSGLTFLYKKSPNRLGFLRPR